MQSLNIKRYVESYYIPEQLGIHCYGVRGFLGIHVIVVNVPALWGWGKIIIMKIVHKVYEIKTHKN